MSNSKFLVNGVQWNVVDQGSGPVLVLIHGFPLDHTMWSGQAALADNYRLIIPDLPGFGQSELVSDSLSMAQTADDIISLLDLLGISEPVAYCGLSMGGYIGWQLWKRHRDRLNCLIGCDTRAVADSPEVASGRRMAAQTVLAEGPASLAAGLIPKLFSPTADRDYPELVAKVRQTIMSTDPRAIAAAQLGMAEREDFSNQLADIELPLLLICGEFDAISTPAEMRGLAKLVPKAQYVEVASAGHMSPLENPAAVNQALNNFLRSCL